MDMTELDFEAIFVNRVRDLQGRHSAAHVGLVNWGKWSNDRGGIYPPDIVPPRLWNEYQSSKWTADEIDEEAGRAEQHEPAKAERAEREPYDELSGRSLDARINERGVLPEFVKDALVIAYGARGYLPEGRYTTQAACSHDAFLERLEAGLKFVARFV